MQVRSVALVVLLSIAALLLSCSKEPSPPAADDAVETTREQVEAPVAESSDVGETQETPAGVVETPDVAGDVAEPPPEREVVATVNGRPVYRDALDASKEALLNQYQQVYTQFGMDIQSMLVGADGRIFELGIESDALERLFFTALVEQEIEARRIVVTDEEISAEFESQYVTFLDSVGMTEDAFVAYLESLGYDIDDFKENARSDVAEVLRLEATQRVVSGPVDLSEDDLQAYFDENRTNYDTEEQVRASHILVETEEEAQQILESLQAGGVFAELAKEHSTCPSAPSGGDLGWFGRGQMVLPFEEVAFALDVDEMSDVVATDFGYHIILLTGRKAETHPELAEVVNQVREDAEGEIIEERFLAWYEEAHDAATFEIKLPVLDARRKQSQDIDLGIAALEQIKQEATVNEPYLPYLLGTAYEAKMDSVIADKEALEASESDDPERDAKLAALNAGIDQTRDKALAAYREALETFSTDPIIQGRIDVLESQTPSSVAP